MKKDKNMKAKRVDLGVWERATFYPRISYDSDRDFTGNIGMALAEAVFEDLQTENLERLMEEHEQRQNYKAFLEREGCLSDSGRMKDALMSHFPRMFGDRGQQPIREYSSEKVYGLYRKMVEYARKAIKH